MLQKSGTTDIDIDEFNLVESDSRKDKEARINYASERETKTKILERSIYLTGYDNLNLQRSKEYHILGWKDRPSKLSTGDYVFVFNSTGDKIDSCFEVKSLSSNKNPIWHEESSSRAVVITNCIS